MIWFALYLRHLAVAIFRAFNGSDYQYEQARLRLQRHRERVPWWPL